MAALLLTAQTSNVTGGGNGIGPSAAPGTLVHHHHKPPNANPNGGGAKEGGDVVEEEGAKKGQEEEGGEEEEEEEEADLDWDAITRFDPARTDVPAYLAARSNLDAAKMALSRSLEEYHASLEHCQAALLNIPANVHNQVDEALQDMEERLRAGFASNAEKRETIEATLHKSAESARALFEGLLMRMAGGAGADTGAAAAVAAGGHGNGGAAAGLARGH